MCMSETGFRAMLNRMLPKPTSVVAPDLYSFRAMLNRMLPKP